MYKVIFVDGTTYECGNYYDNIWKSMPDKPIKQVNFVLPDGNLFVMHSYAAYNYIVEATTDIYAGAKNSQNIGKVVLRYQYFMGRKGDKVCSYRVSLYVPIKKTAKYLAGDITRRIYEFGKEYNGQPTTGWKGKI